MREIVLRDHLVNGGSGKVTVNRDGTVILPKQKAIIPHAPHTGLYAVEAMIDSTPGPDPFFIHTRNGEVMGLTGNGLKLKGKEITSPKEKP